MKVLNSVVLVASLVLAGAAFAAEPAPRDNVVELQAAAQRELANDTITASLYVELSDADPAALAAAVNKAVNAALTAARAYPDVRARSGSNQTYPVYAKGNVLQGWRARAEIRIESKDFASASRLIGQLQAGMRLGNTAFSVSPEARRQVENELIAEGIAAFKARADIVRHALGGHGYKIQRLNVNTGYGAPPPRLAAARLMSSAAPEIAPPDFESGFSLITVNVAGSIEVLD